MLYQFCFVFLMFFNYSVLGWLVECIFCTISDRKLVYDRGFLLGPYCPIYGWGALYMYFFLTPYRSNPVVLFIMAIIGTSILEYMTSYFMEKIFKARWWDYSNRKFHIKGRICLLNSFLFGILGCLFMYVFHPIYLSLVRGISEQTLIVFSVFLFFGYLTDTILTFSILGKLKIQVKSIRKDSTSEIDYQIRMFLSHYNFFIKRLFKAFPRIQILSEGGNSVTLAIQRGLEKIEKERKKYREKIEKARQKRKRKIEKIKEMIKTTKSQRKKERLKKRLRKVIDKKEV